MGAIETLQAKLNNFLNDNLLIRIMEESMNNFSEEISEMNRKQLERGIKADGKLMPPYSRKTVEIRNRRNNPVKGNLIALWDTGDFWSAFWNKAKDGKLIMLSDDPKTKMLIERYGDSIFGLTAENFNKLGEIIMPYIRNKVINYLKS